MLLSFLYLVVRRLLRLLIPGDEIARSAEIEVLILRHELKVLRRGGGRPAYGAGTESSSLRAAGCCHEHPGVRSSWLPRLWCDGTGSWFGASGPTATAAFRVGLLSTRDSGVSSSGWPGRILDGATAGSRGSSESSGSGWPRAHPLDPSGRGARPGPRRGGPHLAGVPEGPGPRASWPATSSRWRLRGSGPSTSCSSSSWARGGSWPRQPRAPTRRG
jgi:hypothetical protein